MCSPASGARRATPHGVPEKSTGVDTMRAVPSVTGASTKAPAAMAWGSSTMSLGPWTGAHHTPFASSRALHSAKLAEANASLSRAMSAGGVDGAVLGAGEAGVGEQLGGAQRRDHGLPVAVGLEPQQVHPPPVGALVGVVEGVGHLGAGERCRAAPPAAGRGSCPRRW